MTQAFDFDSEKYNDRQTTLNGIVPLIEDNRSTGKGHYIVHRKYPTGDVEIIALSKESDDCIFGKGGKRINTEKGSMSDDVLRRSQSRAKREIKRKSLCIRVDRLLTLTYRDNQEDIVQGWSDLQKFARKMKRRYPHFAYVAVPEYQKRGAIHWHLAIRGFYHANTVRRIWTSIVGDGNIDITPPRTEKGKKLKQPKKIANYIAKYISKSDDAEFNKRRYSTGGKIDKPLVRTGWLSYGVSVLQYMERLLKETTPLQAREPFECTEWKMIYLST